MQTQGNCIYMSKRTANLSYKGEEHVFPASLGGATKLPKGTVSDQANSLFSKKESVALRETYIAINRMNFGPGKRGSHRLKAVKNPKIMLCEAKPNETEGTRALDVEYVPFRMGFMFYGTMRILTQFYFPIRKDNSWELPRVLWGTPDEAITEKEMQDFFRKYSTFVAKPNKQAQSDYRIVRSNLELAQKFFLLGVYQNRWYISTSYSDEYIDKFLKLLSVEPLPSEFPSFATSTTEHHYSDMLPRCFDDCAQFLYLKTAFNALAFLMGTDVVRAPCFDDVRAEILECTDLFKYSKIESIPEWLCRWANENVKPKAHFVVIDGQGKIIKAYVSFYRESINNAIILTESYTGKAFKKYAICDFSQPKEQREQFGNILLEETTP